MIKLVSEIIDKQDISALVEWLSQPEIPKLTKGELTIQLENKFADYIGTEYSVFVNSGSSAILLGLLSLLQLEKPFHKKTPKIVVPNLSWSTDVSTPLILGYEVIFSDVNLHDLSYDLSELEKVFKKNKPDYLLLVSVLGLVPDMGFILNLCYKYDVKLIEDNCESLGSEYGGVKLGNFGIMSFYSTYFGHHISTIEGGFVTTNNKELYEMMLMCRSHGWDRDLSQETQKELRERYNIDSFDSLYTFYNMGLNLRSTDLQAFIGLRQLDKMSHVVNKREDNYRYYMAYINNNGLENKLNPSNLVSNFAYPVLSKNRHQIVIEMRKNNIEVRPLIAGSMNLQPFIKNKMYKKNITVKKSYKNSEYIHKYGMYLPNHIDMGESEIKFISEIFNKYS